MHSVKALLLLVYAGLSINLISCSSTEKNSDNPEIAFKYAEEFDQAERYDEAVKKYTEVKNKFPYSQFATKSELAIADVHFKDESFVEAQLAYQTFKELHPKHPEMDYIDYRIGLSFFKQLPETSDKDLSISEEVLKSFNAFIERHPSSKYINEINEKKFTTIKMLAEKEDYIGHFYFIRKIYDSSIKRYEGLINKYPESPLVEKALARLIIANDKIGKKNKSIEYFELLKEKYPKSKELDSARKVIQE